MASKTKILLERTKKFSELGNNISMPSFPKIIMIEPTNKCNYKCVFCESQVSHTKPSFIDIDLVEKVLKDAYMNGTREVGFHLTGEPLLHPNLVEMIKTASDIQYDYIYLTTNGSLATKELVKKLSIAGLHSIKFSINSFEKNEYSKIHGLDRFDIVIENLFDAIALRDSKDTYGGKLSRVMVSTVSVESTNQEAITEFYEKHKNKLDDFFLTKAREKINASPPKENKNCPMIFNRLHVTAHGLLSFCCYYFHHNLIYADLNKRSVVDAWKSELAQAFRINFIKGQIGKTLCDKCKNGYSGKVVPLEY